ncbi:MAG: SufD family Fe-S cluster assembly protein [Epsilonproteobacteria bacterium]|nr:SufD family Fe-S cluster assembly protein [Campylobacterota bacterium]
MCINDHNTATNLDVFLDSSTALTLRLKEVLQEQLIENLVPEDVTVTITLAPYTTVTMIDDLVDFHDTTANNLFKNKLKFVLKEHSVLHYQLKILPSPEENEYQQETDMPHFGLTQSCQTVVEKELEFSFVGKYAQADVQCACFGNGNRVYKVKTLQDHHATNTSSNLVVNSVLDHEAKLFCTNLIKIQKDAQQTDAQQSNKNILLARGARAVAIPQLEIEANDVKCGHGSATSKLNDEHLFYLQSRGIDHKTTRNLLINAFLQ